MVMMFQNIVYGSQDLTENMNIEIFKKALCKGEAIKSCCGSTYRNRKDGWRRWKYSVEKKKKEKKNKRKRSEGAALLNRGREDLGFEIVITIIIIIKI
jgi:hypothetical protein